MNVILRPPLPPLPLNASCTPMQREMEWEEKWWNVNLPEEEWTDKCPEFLLGQSAKDIGIISIRDEDHPRMTWNEVRSLIDTKHIDLFHRMPSDLRRYIKYCYELKQQYGSILYFMQHERLNWPMIEPSGNPPFSCEADYKILCNDWPYAVDPDITHIVVWTKFTLEDDPQTGEVTVDTRLLIEDFVVNTFCRSDASEARMERQNLRWFKNWKRLRSVHALEHFHIMLYRAPQDLVQRVTKGDRPMCEHFI